MKYKKEDRTFVDFPVRYETKEFLYIELSVVTFFERKKVYFLLFRIFNVDHFNT